MSTNGIRKWTWIPRSVEPTVEKWLNTSACVVLIRGQRRSGKSSTLKHCARKLGKTFVELFVKENSDELVRDAKAVFKDESISSEFDITNSILASILKGEIVIVEEIQNASSSFQVALQQVCDTMAFESMHSPEKWDSAGGLFLMGSLPSLVDMIVESRRNPLFQRISAKITIYRLDSLEMVQLFSFLGIDDSSLQLSLHSIFGGKPHAYKLAFQARLFRGNSTKIEEIVKEYFASELQSDFSDATSYYEKEFGKALATGIKSVCKFKNKADQVSNSGEDGFKILHDDLHRRYGVIEPCCSISNLSKIDRFEVTDPLLLLVNEAPSRDPVLREDVTRISKISDEILDRMEGAHFEVWIKEIAQDRYLLCSTSCFPNLSETGHCEFTPKLVWNKVKNTEIDVIASHPSSNTLIYGSCKRSSSKINHKNLFDHVEKLEAEEKIFKCLQQSLKLDTKRPIVKKFYHFVPSINESDKKRIEKDHANVHVVTLADMIRPFNDFRVRSVEETKPKSRVPVWILLSMFLLLPIHIITYKATTAVSL